MCEFEGYSSEWREMADVVLKEVVPSSLGVTWSDCVGLEQCVQLLKEAVIFPLWHPGLFTGLIAPWRGVLLYGPPGTGKTLLSKAVACESKMMFFNVTSSAFIHKWRGDSEKMLKVLFDVAKLHAPSTIFVDELDALTATCDFQHDASRRFRSELLVQLDGVLSDSGQVFILATTNRPWDLDSAILRRFEKRVLVDLPAKEARSEIFKYYFSNNGDRFTEPELKEMAERSADYSGSDIKVACREACMAKLREKIAAKGTRIDKLKVNSPGVEDVIRALTKVRPVTDSSAQEKYKKWRDNFGSY
uniref:AAA+ ATPase domain-containing protein n=1 Tax=Photinus pyralis TaxID=7054 RepID=A0A1Y1NA29_PHOPY